MELLGWREWPVEGEAEGVGFERLLYVGGRNVGVFFTVVNW